MKIRKLLFAGALLALLFSTKHLSAQYLTSGGIRIGGTTGYTVKDFFRPTIAVEGIFGTFGNGYSLTGLVEKYLPAFETPGLFFFYGGGFHLAVYDGNSASNYKSYFGREINYYPHNNIGAGIDGIAGLEYRIDKVPLAVSLDLKPLFEVGSAGHTGFAPDPSIGIRYIFR
jgi:hypothetical protein